MKEKVLAFGNGLFEGIMAIPEELISMVRYIIDNKAYSDVGDIKDLGGCSGVAIFLLFLLWL